MNNFEINLEPFNYSFRNINMPEYVNPQITDDGNDTSIDEMGIRLLTEIYPVLGLLELEQNFNESPEDTFFYRKRDLESLSKYNEQIITLRRLLYSEIMSNEIILSEATKENSLETINSIRDWGKACIERLHNPQTNLPEIESHEKSSDSMIALIKHLNKISNSQSQYFSLTNGMLAIRYSRIIPDFKKIWIMYLLELYSIYLLYNDSANKTLVYNTTNIDNDEDVKNDIISVYKELDSKLLSIQNDNCENLLFITKIPAHTFTKNGNVQKLYDALLTNADLRNKYILKDPSNTRSNGGCFAAMYDQSSKDKYAAISGVINAYKDQSSSKDSDKKINDKYNNYISLLNIILGGEYNIISCDDSVRYYKRTGESITSLDYRLSPLPYDKTPGNRMFSCCERKLATTFQKGHTYKIFCKLSPCPMCLRMINKENKKHEIQIYYFSKYKKEDKLGLSKYDESAQQVCFP